MNGEAEAQAPRRRGARYRNGDILGTKYELERLAGEGSMGEVWLATNLALDLPVAIKLLRTKDAVDPDGHPTLSAALEEHLLHEAQATAKLSHPAIVRVFDFGLTSLGDPFIVMERLEGEDLRDRLSRSGPMSPEASVQLLLPVIHAMHTAHLRGIVHRDLKPENIFLASDDGGRVSPKVVDFGIAELPWLTDVADLVIAGTPAYMAPEQAAGHPNADHRVDIWAVCVALYEMIAGKPPFAPTDGDESFERDVAKDASGARVLPAQLLEREPTPLAEETGADAALWAIVVRGLAPIPAKRWRSMRELGEALAEWLFSRGIEEDVRGISLRARWLYDAPSRLNLTPTPLPVSVTTPPRIETTTTEATPSVDPARSKSGVVSRIERERPASRDDHDREEPVREPSLAVEPASVVSASMGAPKSRGSRASRTIAIVSLVLGASGGALLLKLSESPAPPPVRQTLARSAQLIGLEAEQSLRSTQGRLPGAGSSAPKDGSSATPKSATKTPKHVDPTPAPTRVSADASSTPATSAAPTEVTPTAAPRPAAPEAPIYPDSL